VPLAGPFTPARLRPWRAFLLRGPRRACPAQAFTHDGSSRRHLAHHHDHKEHVALVPTAQPAHSPAILHRSSAIVAPSERRNKFSMASARLPAPAIVGGSPETVFAGTAAFSTTPVARRSQSGEHAPTATGTSGGFCDALPFCHRFQMRCTPTSRFSNRFTAWTPGRSFQICTSRCAGQTAPSAASSNSVLKQSNLERGAGRLRLLPPSQPPRDSHRRSGSNACSVLPSLAPPAVSTSGDAAPCRSTGMRAQLRQRHWSAGPTRWNRVMATPTSRSYRATPML
jgi:hypothetical protein